MKKGRRIAAAVFGAGILISGLGAGAAAVEFSGLTYTGVEPVGNVNMQTEEGELAISDEAGLCEIWSAPDEMEIVWDASIPRGKLKYRFSYNADRVTPEIKYIKEDGAVRIWGLWKSYDGLGALILAKDKVLGDLKKKQFGNYQIVDFEEVKLFLNPVYKEQIELVY